MDHFEKMDLLIVKKLDQKEHQMNDLECEDRHAWRGWRLL